MRRLLFHLDRSRERVVAGIGLAALERLGDEHVDRRAVLGVHHDRRAEVRGRLHRAKDLSVVGVEDPRVGHEELEARDAFVVREIGHRLQGRVVDAADDLVEAVVDRAVAVGLLVPRGESVVHVLARSLHREVDDRRGAAEGGRDRAGLEGVRGVRAAEGQLHVGVDVDAAGDDVLPVASSTRSHVGFTLSKYPGVPSAAISSPSINTS